MKKLAGSAPLVAVLFLTSLAEARMDRSSWLRLYDSPDTMAKGAAVLYVDGMANGLSIANAMDGKVQSFIHYFDLVTLLTQIGAFKG
jgi:hypothetical protein